MLRNTKYKLNKKNTYSRSKRDEFHDAFKGEAQGEGEVHVAEDVSEK